MLARRTLIPALLLVALTGGLATRADLGARGIRVPEAKAHLSFGKGARPALDPRTVRVLVWNVKKGEEPGLDRDLPAYGADRDLILLSEGIINPTLRPIFGNLPEHRWDMGVAFIQDKGPGYPTGTLIGSVVEPTRVTVRQTRDLEPIIKTPKALTIAEYPVDGRAETLLAVSVHGINAVTPAAFARHMEIARAAVAAHVGPAILAGDFNTNLKSKVSHLRALARKLGMSEVAFRDDDRMTVLGQKIDYIFIRGLKVRDADVLGLLTSSDHKAMRAELSID